jgi:hypothetical protein
LTNSSCILRIWVGKLKHSKDKIEGIKWYEKPIKTLGVYFGNNKEECEKLNWENKIDKMNTLFFSWVDPHPFLSRFAIFLYKNQEYILNILSFFCIRYSLKISTNSYQIV